MATTFEAIFSLIDKASGPILKMEENFRKLGTTAAAANKMMTPHQKLFSHVQHDLGELGAKFGEIGKSAQEFGSRVGDILGPLAALGAVGSVAGIVEMAHSFAEATEQLYLGSKIAGVTVQQLQGLQYAAKMTGVSTEGLQKSLGMLNRNLGLAGAGKNKDLVALFAHLHINLRDSHGALLSATQDLPKLADAFAATKDPAEQALMATKLFGRAGLQMIPLLDQGSKGLAAYEAAFKKYGYTLSNTDVDAGNAFNESWKNMQTAIGGLTDDISAKLAPVITPLITMMADWTAKNRDWIASNLASAVRNVSDSLKTIDFAGIMRGMTGFANASGRVVDALGGWKPVLIAVGGALTLNFLAPLITIGAQVSGLALSMGGVLARAVLGVGASMIEIVPTITKFRDIFAALDLVMEANPLGVALIAATALAAAGLILYNNWKPVKQFFEGLEKDLNGVNSAMQRFLGFGNGGAPQADGTLPGGGKAFQPRGQAYRQFQLSAPDAGPAQSSSHVITLNIPNAPAGTTASVATRGPAPRLQLNIGQSSMSHGGRK